MQWLILTPEAIRCFTPQVLAEDEGRMRPFEVKIKWVTSVSIRRLFDFIGGQLQQLPQDSIQALDVALMHGGHLPATMPVVMSAEILHCLACMLQYDLCFVGCLWFVGAANGL